MSKVRILSIAVVLLLVLNGITLAMLLRRHGPHDGVPPHERPKMMVIERIGFDADQVRAYEALILEHRKAIDAKDEELGNARRELFNDLQATDTARRDSLVQVIAHLQSEVELIHHAHFAEVRALCRPDQLPRFDAMIGELADFFGKPRPEGPRP
ncbi:MAG TPA: hypothetical protein PK760_11395 [Flavobacteriales bacterium]|nr:hypothetical protein [Flavobacteriales bacterium]